VRDLVCDAGLMDGGDGVTPPTMEVRRNWWRQRPLWPLRECLSQKRAFRIRPWDRSRRWSWLRRFSGDRCRSSRADVEAHPAIGRSGDGNRLRDGVGLEFGTNDVVDGKKQGEFLLLRLGAKALGKVDLLSSTSDLPMGWPSL